MQDEIISRTKKDFEVVIDIFQSEISKINIGRANVSLVEDLSVQYYGSATPLKKIAQISTPDPRTISVLPWDKNSLSDIESAINNSELNLKANSDGIKLIISLPLLTEERRTELGKIIKARDEESKVALRNIRQKIWEDIQDKVKKGEYTEDDKYRFEEELNKLINEYNTKIDEISKSKTEEIMKV
jgi:ribosome recycling factor